MLCLVLAGTGDYACGYNAKKFPGMDVAIPHTGSL